MSESILQGCAGCGADLPSISATIRTAVGYLVNGHAGVREMYRVLEMKAINTADKEAFRLEAEKHDRIARECAKFVLPEEAEVPNVPGVQSQEAVNYR